MVICENHRIAEKLKFIYFFSLIHIISLLRYRLK